MAQIADGSAVLGSAVRCRPSAVDFAVNGDSGLWLRVSPLLRPTVPGLAF